LLRANVSLDKAILSGCSLAATASSEASSFPAALAIASDTRALRRRVRSVLRPRL
jgi:hypothetical protein